MGCSVPCRWISLLLFLCSRWQCALGGSLLLSAVPLLCSVALITLSLHSWWLSLHSRWLSLHSRWLSLRSLWLSMCSLWLSMCSLWLSMCSVALIVLSVALNVLSMPPAVVCRALVVLSVALTVLGGASALFILCLLLYAVHWPLHASHSFLAAFLGNFYDVSPEQITVEAHIRGTIGTKGTTHAFSNAEAAFQGLFSSSLDYCSCV